MGKKVKKDDHSQSSKTNGNTQAISSILHLIKSQLEGIKSGESQTLDQVLQWSKKNGIQVPFFGIPKVSSVERAHLKFTILPPTNVTVVGSFLLETMVAPANVDLAVEFPISLVDEKDELNYRFLMKKAHYLAYIAGILRKVTELKDAELRWDSVRGHVLSPVLLLILKDLNLEIRIHVTLPSNAFKYHRFGPTRSLVRKATLVEYDHPVDLQKVSLDSVQENPTLINNSLLLKDMLMVEHLKLLHAQCKAIPALKQCIKLGKAWIQQRSYTKHAFHFSGFQFSMICVYLAQRGILVKSMTDLQLFKSAMTFLSEVVWKVPLFFTPPSSLEFIPEGCQEEFSGEVFAKAFSASLIEPIAGMNILFDWTAEVAAEVKYDAQQAVKTLNSTAPDMDRLFLLSDHQLSKFDSYYQIVDFTWMPDATANFAHYQSQYMPDVARSKMIAKKLSYALNSRVTDLFVHANRSSHVALGKSIPNISSFGVGLLLDRNESSRIVELGPFADNIIEAKQFRQFWRDRADLRRFPDGSIREAVAWDKLSNMRHLVVQDVMHFVFNVHFSCENLHSYDDRLDFAWRPNNEFSPVQETIALFSKNIKSLSDLPLSVSQCEPISSTGRMTSVESPLQVEKDDLKRLRNRLPFYCAVIEMVINLEGSSRWPEEYYGMLYAKQAFSVQICRLLIERFGFEVSLTSEYFDVLVSGYILRCYISQPNEVKLMSSNGLDTTRVKQIYLEEPKHARKIAALSQGYAMYGPVCRLVKRWLSSQMFSSPLISEELIELLVANSFLDVAQPQPNTIGAGFVRVLQVLLRHDWQQSPLLVDFEHGESKTWSIERAKTVFEAISGDERPVLYVAPSYEEDGDCCIWSRQSFLNVDELSEIQNYASTLLRVFDGSDDCRIRFRPSPSRFDLVIHLDSSIVTTSHMALPGVVEEEEEAVGEISNKLSRLINKKGDQDRLLRALPGFSPVQTLLTNLKRAFPEARFYHDSFGGRVIGVRHQDITSSIKKRILEVGGELIAKVE